MAVAQAASDDALGRALSRAVCGRSATTAVQRAGEAPAPAPQAQGEEIRRLQGSDDTLTGARIAITHELLALIAGAADHSEPPILKKHRADSALVAVPGTAFGGAEPSPEDVRQGGVGDCYLLAAMAAVAKANPAAIKRMITDNGDGTFDITLYEDTAWFGVTLEKRVVKVTNTFAVKDDALVYAQLPRASYGAWANGLSAKVALWVVLIEKAYAQHKGGYAEIEGGYAGKGMQVLTGQKSTQHVLDDLSEAQIVATLKTLVANKHAITASPRCSRLDSSTVVKQQEAKNIVRRHAYSLLRYDEATNEIHLRNPTGFHHPDPVSPAEFKELYRWFESAPTNP